MPKKAYVALIGRAAFREDVAAKLANLDALADKWFLGGPTDPNVVYFDFIAENSGPHREGLCQIRCAALGRPRLSARDRAGFSKKGEGCRALARTPHNKHVRTQSNFEMGTGRS